MEALLIIPVLVTFILVTDRHGKTEAQKMKDSWDELDIQSSIEKRNRELDAELKALEIELKEAGLV